MGGMWTVQGQTQLCEPSIDTIRHMGQPRTYIVKAEPLKSRAFKPFGQVIDEGDMQMELRDEEVFHLNVLHYERAPLLCDHLNRHHRATQALVPLGGRPAVVVVGPPELDYSTDEHLPSTKAFIMDGTAGINLGLHVWHWGPYPLMEHLDLVNVQGKYFDSDNEVAYLERDLGLIIEIAL